MIRLKLVVYLTSIMAALVLVGCSGDGVLGPTATETASVTPFPTFPSRTPTNSPTPRPTLRASSTPIPTATIVPSLTPEPTLSPTPGVFGLGVPSDPLRDDFSDPNSGWTDDGSEEYGFGYEGGAYVIYNNLGFAEVCSARSRDFIDVVIDVDVEKVDGPNNAYFGVTCRKQGAEGLDYYTLAVNGRGQYRISETFDGEPTLLVEGSNSAIRTGDARNHLQASCVGTLLSLRVNGELVGEVNDSSYIRSDFVGLIVGTLDQAGVEVVFDNFNARAPEK